MYVLLFLVHFSDYNHLLFKNCLKISILKCPNTRSASCLDAPGRPVDLQDSVLFCSERVGSPAGLSVLFSSVCSAFYLFNE